ncbi:MAG: M20 family metallopeptidase [Actinomycetota bacterium]|nr:M20 family metallopeptidase [Actinomycetota bacterium]
MNLLTESSDLSADLIALRRTLHAIPEVGLQLPVTQQALLAELDDLGLEISTGTQVSSITGVLRGGQRTADTPVVLLRADMDGLPVTERTGEPFAPAADSPHHAAMHACGHDLHMAGLIGAARLLAAHRDELPGDVVFMLQPGEEGFDGARYMVDEGVLDAAGKRVDSAYGLHVFSGYFPKGTVAARPGPLMAASAGLHVRVIGAGGHGSSPHMSKDPIPAAAEMVTALQTMVTRRFNVFDPVVVTVGSFHAGTKRNVIPDEAVFDATVRTFSPEASQQAAEFTVRLCEQIAAAHGLTVQASFEGEYPVTVNNASEYEFAAGVARDLFGADRFSEMTDPLTGSEDFSRVLNEVPGAYLFVGASKGDPAKSASNHSPLAAFDDSILPDNATLLAELAVRRLHRA